MFGTDEMNPAPRLFINTSLTNSSEPLHFSTAECLYCGGEKIYRTGETKWKMTQSSKFMEKRLYEQRFTHQPGDRIGSRDAQTAW